MIDFCPGCGVNLITKRTRFRWLSRVEGVQVPEVFEGVLYWRCPDCGRCWHRWPPGTPGYAVAERYLREHL